MADGTARQVLLVDDLAEQREIYRAVLERRGFGVIEAVDGEGALRLAETERPDLIVIDVGLPWMDGWEVTRRLRAIPRTAGIPVLAMSAQVDEQGVGLAAEAGCNGFVPKTGDPNSIADAVTDLIGKAAG
jgi:CheY-like chemotaxis protein